MAKISIQELNAGDWFNYGGTHFRIPANEPIDEIFGEFMGDVTILVCDSKGDNDMSRLILPDDTMVELV